MLSDTLGRQQLAAPICWQNANLLARLSEAWTRISCHAAPDKTARAPFTKERRMNLAKATKFHRKSGGGLGNQTRT